METSEVAAVYIKSEKRTSLTKISSQYVSSFVIKLNIKHQNYVCINHISILLPINYHILLRQGYTVKFFFQGIS